MASSSLPSVTLVPSLSAEERAQVLDLLFEPSTQLHTLSVSTLSEQSFPNYAALIQQVQSQLEQLYQSDLASDQKWLEAILSAHPRLGEKKVDSALSRSEQAGLQTGSTGGSEDQESDRLRILNQKYEEKFPGLIYVTFVNNRSRPVIMEDMQNRIESSTIEQEKQDATKQGIALKAFLQDQRSGEKTHSAKKHQS